MPTTSSIQIPSDFICPLMKDVMTDPLKAIEEPTQKSFLSRIFAYLVTNDNPTCKNHFFEKQALEYLLRLNQEYYCSVCHVKITKALPDITMAKKIQNQFVNANEQNKKHFQEAKVEANRVYGNRQNQATQSSLIDTNIASPSRRSSDGTYQRASHLFRRSIFHSHHPLYMVMHPIIKSPDAIYSDVVKLINNDNLTAAERKANGIINSYYKNLSYQQIAEKYLSQLYPRFNPSRIIIDLRKAINITQKITTRQIKNDLYFKIFQKASKGDHLQLAEKVAKLISDNNLKDNLLSNLIEIYIRKNKLKKAQDLNISISLSAYQDNSLGHIAKAYIDRSFSIRNFQKALILANKISDNDLRNSTYTYISQKCDANKRFVRSFKTTAKITKLSIRLKQYIKTTLKIVFFAIYKAFIMPFKFVFSGFNMLRVFFNKLLPKK